MNSRSVKGKKGSGKGLGSASAQAPAETEKILKTALAKYMGRDPESFRLVSYRELREEELEERPVYLNTDGGNRNEKLYSKDRWKSL